MQPILCFSANSKGKERVHPTIGYEGPEGEHKCNSTLSLTLAARWEWVVNATPLPLYPQERDLVPIG
jgi:hypothetical protein